MSAIITNKARLNTTKNIIDSFDDSKQKYYLYVGKSTPWTDENSPDVPVANTLLSRLVSNDEMFIKQIQYSNVTNAIRRYDWSYGSIYRQYNSWDDIINPVVDNITIYPFYTITTLGDVYRVYKCIINNNSGQSTINPATIDTGTLTGGGSSDNGLIYCSDGYVWKFMYDIPYSYLASDLMKFVSPNWLPVRNSTYNDSTRQWSVQNLAVSNGIESLVITNPGSGYINGNLPTITISSPTSGTQATIYTLTSANYSSGSIIGPIKISNPGTGYFTEPTITITNPVGFAGVSLQVRAVVSPFNGHGFDAVSELGAASVVIYMELVNSESGNLTTDNTYRRIGIIKNPIQYSTIHYCGGYQSTIGSTLMTNLNASNTNYINIATAYNNIILDSSVNSLTGTLIGRQIKLLAGTSREKIATILQYDSVTYTAILDITFNSVNDDRPIIGQTSYGFLVNNTEENELWKLLLNGNPTSFNLNATLTQSSSGATGIIVDFVASPDGGTTPAYLLMSNIIGTFTDNNSVSDGTNSAVSATTNAFSKNGSERYYGDIIYNENKRYITRTATQTEQYRIIFKY